MNTNTFITYRNGAGDLEQRLRAAVAHFYQERGELPAAVTVHKTELDGARVAMQSLDLALPVAGSGGCLVGECWLALPKTNGGQP